LSVDQSLYDIPQLYWCADSTGSFFKGGVERCAVSFATAAIRLNDLLSAEAEDVSAMGDGSKDSDDNVSQSSVLTAVSEPVPVKGCASDRRLDVSDVDSDSIVSSPCEGEKGVRRRFGEKLSRRWRSGESHLSAGPAHTSAMVRCCVFLSTETYSKIRYILDVNDRSLSTDRESVESNETKSEKSKLAVIFDKAKSKGKKLVSSNKAKKNSGENASRLVEEACQAIILTAEEEVSLDATLPMDGDDRRKSGTSLSLQTNSSADGSSLLNWVCWESAKRSDNEADAQAPQPFLFRSLAMRCLNLPLFRQRLALLVVLVGLTVIIPGFISGFLWGLYLSFIAFLYFFVSEPVPSVNARVTMASDVMFSISKELEQRKSMKNVVYKGWMNELRGRYDSATYHVNSAQSVLVRLDGKMLRISRPERNVLKHAFHTDPTLSEPEPTIRGQSIYDLTDAVVSLRPKRLAMRRWWSRKYPIHIRLANAQSEISTIDTVMQRSQSAHQSVAYSKKSSDDVPRSDSADSGRSKSLLSLFRTASAENSVSDSREQGYDPDESSEDDEQAPPAVLRNGRASSVGDVSASTGVGEHDSAKLCPYKPRGRSLFLFVRSAREKERWFHR
uniref:SMP-LTD domain-containing protein n=1 Tax=Toxocara canis TaxID=6265 RepID=A0A183UHD6_TOXCA